MVEEKNIPLENNQNISGATNTQNPEANTNAQPAIKKKLIKKAEPQAHSGPKPPPEKPFTTIVLGETGVGKTYKNIKHEIRIYLLDMPNIGKKGRKVLIYDVNNDYEGIRMLKPTAEAIFEFVKQPKVEARRILGRDDRGRPLSKEQNYEQVKMILDNFIDGMILLDDIDRYAVHSSKQDLVSILMGNRHNGMHVLISHQAWRKMSVTECENVRYIRLHHCMDEPESLPAEKLVLFDFHLLKIASLIVEEQYDLACDMYEENKLTEKQWEIHKSFCVYIDVRRKKLKGCTEPAFQRAAYKYMYKFPKVVQRELDDMVMLGQLPKKEANTIPSRNKAMARLYEKFKRYLPKQNVTPPKK